MLTLDEATVAARMESLVAAGRPAEALALYARVRDLLWETEGREPDADLRGLQATLLAQAIRRVPQQRSRRPGDDPHLPPESSTTFVGRDGLATTVIDLLGTARVVTLHGPGGVGKTRLALHCAHRIEAAGTPVAWVDLAPVRDAEGAVYAAADAIGVRDIALDDPIGSLVRALGEQSAVVVVDNCEHLLDVAAHLVDGLQSRSAGTTVLTTSRERLDVDGEHVVPVPPLATDRDPEGRVATGTAADSPALRLFGDRLATARGHGLEPAEVADAVAVTERLDGLPLALELAAGRAAALGLSPLRDRVGLDLLDRGRRTGSERHRSLRAVVDWSYALLDDPERALFARLSVFAGTFSLARAEVVCADDRVPADRLPSLLSGLVDRSLVSTVRQGDETRHRLLQPLREYGAQQLAASDGGRGEASRRWRTAHARHMADVAAARAPALHGPAEEGVTAQLVEDLDETRAALAHAQTGGDVDTALRLVDAMHDLGSRQMRLELLGWADTVTRLPGAGAHPLYPNVLGSAAKGRWLRGDHAGARERAQEALVAAPDADDLRRVRALLATAEVNLLARRLDDAVDFYRQAVRVGAGPGPTIDAEGGLAMTLADLGRVDEGREWADRCLRRAEGSGSPSHLAWAWYARARCWAPADPGEAATMLRKASELSHGVGNRSCEYSAITRLLVVREPIADPPELLAEYRGTLDRWRRTGSTTFLALTLRNLAGLLDRLGRAEQAQELARAVDATAVDGSRVDRAYALALEVIDGWDRPAVPRPRAPTAPRAGVFRSDAGVWTVGLDGAQVHLPDSKGMRDLAVLLARPGIEVHCLDLAVPAGTAPSESDLGEVVDATARSAYERRLRDLRAEIETRGENGDVDALQEEMDALVAELARAYGLGGRPRRAGDPVEKARTAVTWRIRHALTRIGAAHPALGAHLTRSVRTGRFCVYAPDETVTWRLTG